MNKYLVPVCDSDGSYICSVAARSLAEAEDKFINELSDIYAIDKDFNNFDEFIKEALESDIVIGDIYDIDEF